MSNRFYFPELNRESQKPKKAVGGGSVGTGWKKMDEEIFLLTVELGRVDRDIEIYHNS